MNNSIFYAIGTGPGDSDFLTLQSVKILKACNNIFYPVIETKSRALDTISSVIDLTNKKLYPIEFNMNGRDEDVYEKNSLLCCKILEKGEDAAFITIGDVSLYSTAAKMASIIQERGYRTRFIAGISSFSSAAALAGISLAQNDEGFFVIPGDNFYKNRQLEQSLSLKGCKVIMKSKRYFKQIISLLDEKKLIEKSIFISNASLPECRIIGGKKIKELANEDSSKNYMGLFIIQE